MQDDDDSGHWGTVSDAAQAFGVSVDTIRRRMKKGDLNTRREQTPQGFRWLIRLPDDVPPEPAQNVPGSAQTAAPIDQGAVAIYGPDPRDTLIETLQRELHIRNREVARLHEVIGQQAVAIDRTTAALAAGPTTTPPPEPSADSLPRRGFWSWLLGRKG